MTGWISAAAACRGASHIRRGERLQDAVQVRHWDNGVLLVAADGAGSAARGGAGAFVATRTAAAAMCAAVADAGWNGLDEGDLHRVVAATRANVVAAAERAGRPPRDLATTLVLALSNGSVTLAAHVGDGAAALQRADGAWEILSWPTAGPHAGTTHFLTDEPQPEVKTLRRVGDVRSLAVLTDGMERLVLDFASGAPHAPFFDMVARPLEHAGDGETATGLHRPLSLALHRYLRSEPVSDRTDDDKTLAIAVRRSSP